MHFQKYLTTNLDTFFSVIFFRDLFKFCSITICSHLPEVLNLGLDVGIEQFLKPIVKHIHVQAPPYTGTIEQWP